MGNPFNKNESAPAPTNEQEIVREDAKVENGYIRPPPGRRIVPVARRSRFLISWTLMLCLVLNRIGATLASSDLNGTSLTHTNSIKLQWEWEPFMIFFTIVFVPIAGILYIISILRILRRFWQEGNIHAIIGFAFICLAVVLELRHRGNSGEFNGQNTMDEGGSNQFP